MTKRRSRLLLAAPLLVGGYLALAYLAAPLFWETRERERGLIGLALTTRTAQDIPGDPVNVGLVGVREDVVRAFVASGWAPADPVTLRTSVEIAGSVLLDRAYRDAPVSPLYLLGRRQDLAFEREVGRSADQRHHVRLWRVLDNGADGRPVWLGSASFDRGVGFSRYTGQITHHIAPDVDAERDFFIDSLASVGMLSAIFTIAGEGPALNARNGGGDPYFTDGLIRIGRLTPGGVRRTQPPERLESDPLAAFGVAITRAVINAVTR